MDRKSELLKEVAKGFIDWPSSFLFPSEWLRYHNVTIDELRDLYLQIGYIINGFLNSPTHVQAMIIVKSIEKDVEVK